MFQNLRKGQNIYVLYKNDPRIEIGEVDSVGIPTPQFAANQYQQYQPPMQKNCIDIKVKLNDQIIDLQKLPAEGSIADFGSNGMVISTNKDAILQEIELMRTNSQKILDSVERHKQNVEQCTRLIEELNPHLKREAELRKQIETLTSELSSVKTQLSEVLNNQK